jgi:hypothetical protein
MWETPYWKTSKGPIFRSELAVSRDEHRRVVVSGVVVLCECIRVPSLERDEVDLSVIVSIYSDRFDNTMQLASRLCIGNITPSK